MMNKIKNQTGDQTAKGAFAALIIYALYKLGLDSDFVLLLTPVLMGVLAWASKKVGDSDLASFFTESGEDQTSDEE